MDRALYVAMTGALQTLRAQTVNAHNIANAATTGFKAHLVESQAVPVDGPGLPTRVNSAPSDAQFDGAAGGIQATGRELDVAFGEDLWLAVQAPDGSEGYTRAGDLQLDANGQLRTASGHAVFGDGGLMSIPPASSLSIAADGTVSIVPLGQSPNTMATVGRLKVVTAKPSQLLRGDDNLMRAREGIALQPASGTVLSPGMLEASNVSLPEAMVNMIQLARAFEMQMKVMKTVEDNAQASQTLMRL